MYYAAKKFTFGKTYLRGAAVVGLSHQTINKLLELGLIAKHQSAPVVEADVPTKRAPCNCGKKSKTPCKKCDDSAPPGVI